MGNIMVFISGVVALLAGIGLFLFAFRIFKPMMRTNNAEERYKNWIEKYGKASKYLSLGLILFGTYNIIQNNPDDRQENQVPMSSEREWTNNDKEKLTDECVKMYMSQEQLSETDANVAKDYCECTTEKMTNQFSITDLIAHDTLSREEKILLYEPVVETCIKDLEFQIQNNKGTNN